MSGTLRVSAPAAAMVALLALSVAGDPLSAQAAAPSPAGWYRGNTHAHTSNSDGDSAPEVVARWYRDHGYHFLFITDHESITDVAPLNRSVGGARFLLLPGQEVTQRVADADHADGRRQTHLNALGSTHVVMPLGENHIVSGMSVAAVFARNSAAVRQAGGIAQINHPNYRWSVTFADLVDLPDSTLFEVWNGHPTVYNDGGAGTDGVHAPSTDAMWDSVLTRGTLLFGVASDDSHSFAAAGADDPYLTRPGRGWVMVRADTLTADAVLGALRRGDFYASTGVTLLDYAADEHGIRLAIQSSSDRRYRTDFIGSGGRTLATAHGTSAAYRFRGGEGYVRARVTDSSGRRAWTQPVTRAARDAAAPAAAPAAAMTPRVATYNIRAGSDLDRQSNLVRIAALIDSLDIDVILMQEVDRLTRRSGIIDQPAELARLLGYHMVFGASMQFDGGEFGNAVLSRWPIDRSHVLKYDEPDAAAPRPAAWEPRSLLHAVIGAPGGALHVVNTHVDHQGDAVFRSAQLAQLRSYVSSAIPSDALLVVGGDLNARPDAPEIREVAGLLDDAWTLCSSGDGFTFRSDAPDRRIDYLMLRGAGCSSARVPAVLFSDHRPLVVDVRPAGK